MEHPFGGSWGYQVTGYFAPTSRFGTPDDFRYFVDHLHQRGVGVIADWVPAHFPKDDWALARFDGTALYEHADPRKGEHPDWGTLVFNYGRHEVRNFLIANALYWMDEFHIDGLRVDAVASMLYLDYSRKPGSWVPNEHGGRENLEAIGFLRQLNTLVFAEHPGVVMIAEESTSWPGVSHPVHHNGLGFSHKWNMGWMHDTLGYFAHDPVHRRWHHRDLTFGLLYAFSERFVLPLSHDEVVHAKGSLLNKMPGDEWRRFANLRALYGWMWAYPGDPMLFMGGEIAQWGEWSETKGVDWAALKGERHRGVQELVRALNRVAGEWPALTRAGPGAQRVPVARRGRRRPLDVQLPPLVGRRAGGGGLRRQHDAGAARGLPRRAAVGRRVAGAARHERDLLRRDGPGRAPGGVGGRRRAPPGPAGLGVPHRPAARGDLARLPRHVTDVPSGRAVVTASLALGVAVGLVGVSFGVLAVANGLTVAAGHGHVAPRVHRRVAVRRRRGPGRRRQRSGGRGQRPAPRRPQRRLRPGAGPDPAGIARAAGCWRRSSSSTSRRPWPPRSRTGRARPGPSGSPGWRSSAAGTPAP